MQDVIELQCMLLGNYISLHYTTATIFCSYANTYSFLYLDINECVLGTSGCTQLCNNTVGSYTFYCNTGYTLDINNLTCNGECHNSYANCHTHTKINVDGKLSRHY